MKQLKVAREQQVAVFGESGSGKTVLLSSFYGAAQEPAFLKQSLFAIDADDTAQGRKLHQFFLGMKNAGATPPTNRFSATKYVFSVKRRPRAMEKGKKAAAEELRLVWHDYPGEWFEEDPSTPEEVTRRAETFSALVGSDVAVLLIDAQRLTDNSGEEERYLKALLTNYISHVSRVRDELLPDGQRLVRFPRVWIFGLSKADLLPDVDVTTFRDLLVEKVGQEMSLLQEELAAFVEEPEAFSLGEDFVLLSSARFEPGRIDVGHQVGVRLMLPIAAMLPFSRYVRWAKALRTGGKVASELVKYAGSAITFLTALKLPGKLKIFTLVLPFVADPLLEFSTAKIQAAYDTAVARHDFLAAVLLGFRLDLDRAVEEQVLVESTK
ncbi:TRAFAC clade GTPase domain-containing protein [Plantibacter sp. T3]|uniref:TRAFAC clade GTPase domain-containing protein n=1 Tax=Plantibacter sp. T3 TaxID=2653161 RepID=UPI0012F2FBA0|nr:ATP/GTP-binding protein [Plantibacter sp. T3]VXB28241.1 ATP/GTP-binding protein [Plantibacter sp. T3]